MMVDARIFCRIKPVEKMLLFLIKNMKRETGETEASRIQSPEPRENYPWLMDLVQKDFNPINKK